MKTLNLKTGSAVVISLALALAGCGSGGPNAVDFQEDLGQAYSPRSLDRGNRLTTSLLGQGERPVAAIQDQGTSPVASVVAWNGATVSFYDLDGGVLFTETGKAGNVTALSKVSPGAFSDLSEIWNELAPGTFVPTEIVDLQRRRSLDPSALERIQHIEPSGEAIGNLDKQQMAADAPILPVEPGGDASGSVYRQQTAREVPGLSSNQEHTLANDGNCDNGCCDPNWTVNEMCALYGDWYWYLFEYGYSEARTTSKVYWAWSTACAGIGWSHFNFIAGGISHAWWVPEGNYYNAYYDGRGTSYSYHNIISDVNMDSDHNLHTQCGTVYR